MMGGRSRAGGGTSGPGYAEGVAGQAFPRRWGNLCHKVNGAEGAPSTPARTGTPHQPHLLSRTGRKHPRAYGDTVTSQRGPRLRCQAPPRVRRHHKHPQLTKAIVASTPARTETPRIGRRSNRSAGKHPRAYGETTAGCWSASPQARAPPRVRGNRGGCSSPTAGPPSTPARTGKPPSRLPMAPPSSKHPRAYGETR